MLPKRERTVVEAKTAGERKRKRQLAAKLVPRPMSGSSQQWVSRFGSSFGSQEKTLTKYLVNISIPTVAVAKKKLIHGRMDYSLN